MINSWRSFSTLVRNIVDKRNPTIVIFLSQFFLFPQPYDSNLFSKTLPCLCAIANALPADYGLSPALEKLQKQSSIDAEGRFLPNPIDTKGLVLL